MKTVTIIPCRYGSTRFEGKPLAHLAGVPIVQRVYQNATKARKIDQVLVATDDKRIQEVVESFKGQCIMTSNKHPSGTDRVAEAAAKLGLVMDDLIINLQGDQPLIDPRCLDQVITPFSRDPQLSMSTLAFKIIDQQEYINSKDVKVVMDHQGDALYFSRAPIPYGRDAGQTFDAFKHLGVYAYTRKFLEKFRKLPVGYLEQIEKLEQLRVLEYGHRIQVVVTEYDSPEVDLPEDIARIEKLMES